MKIIRLTGEKGSKQRFLIEQAMPPTLDEDLADVVAMISSEHITRRRNWLFGYTPEQYREKVRFVFRVPHIKREYKKCVASGKVEVVVVEDKKVFVFDDQVIYYNK